MAFKKKAVVNARLDQMSKAALVKTVKTLRGRETKLLNQVAKLEREVDQLQWRAHLPHQLQAKIDSHEPPVTFPWEQPRADVGDGNNQTECTDTCSERANDCDQEEGA